MAHALRESPGESKIILAAFSPQQKKKIPPINFI
jgi:hypothetical protein